MGCEYDGVVTNVTDYGIFVELNGNLGSGMCHVSCFGTEERVEDPHDMFSVDDKVTTWFVGYKNGDRMRLTMVNPDIKVKKKKTNSNKNK